MGSYVSLELVFVYKGMGLKLAHFSNFAQGAAKVAGAVSTAYNVGKRIYCFAQSAAPVVATAAALL